MRMTFVEFLEAVSRVAERVIINGGEAQETIINNT
jgi:hypothetical protein